MQFHNDFVFRDRGLAFWNRIFLGHCHTFNEQASSWTRCSLCLNTCKCLSGEDFFHLRGQTIAIWIDSLDYKYWIRIHRALFTSFTCTAVVKLWEESSFRRKSQRFLLTKFSSCPTRMSRIDTKEMIQDRVPVQIILLIKHKHSLDWTCITSSREECISGILNSKWPTVALP